MTGQDMTDTRTQPFIVKDTSTFDKITKDRAAKFVDMLSAIGGTMGLLTGFSLISGMEIVYFGVKIILQILNNRLCKKKSSLQV